MTALYAIPLLVGVIGLVATIVVVAYRSTAGGDPTDAPTGTPGRAAVAVSALIGFGMAGLSSLYGGWPTWSTPIAAIAGAAGLAAVTWWLGPSRGA